MELKQETICENTLEIVREYYSLNTEPLFSVVSDDCVWLGTGNLLVSGAAAIKDFFKEGFIMPAYRLEEPDFQLIETGCEGQLVVLGQYTLYSDKDAQLVNAVKQRSTFCYRQEKGKWRLYHMHISNEWSDLVGDEIFPLQISTQTYRYVKKLLAESISENPPMLMIKTATANQFIDTNMVIYIQAMDKSCVLHMLNERKQISQMLKNLREQLPPNFYRIHRSFFVNSDYVTKIHRYAVTLVTGEELPVPKMRYTQIREELTALIERRLAEKTERPVSLERDHGMKNMSL